MTKYAWRGPSGAAWVGTRDEAEASGCEFWPCWDRTQAQGTTPLVTDRRRVTGVRIDPEERRILEAQTGQKFHDRSDLNCWMKRNDKRIEESGESNDRILKEALQGAPEPQWRPDPRKAIDWRA